jgi:quinol monooxygenase YgiN
MAKRLTVEFVVNEGMGADFESIALPITARVRDEDAGCLQYHIYQAIEDESHYVLVEAWENAEALAAHGTSPATADFAKLEPLLAEKPVLHRYED